MAQPHPYLLLHDGKLWAGSNAGVGPCCEAKQASSDHTAHFPVLAVEACRRGLCLQLANVSAKSGYSICG